MLLTFVCYIRWNRLDFTVLLVGIVGLGMPSAGVGVSGLRALRALRPLRAFQLFAPLQTIVESIWRSMRFLGTVFICLAFFFLLFGLLGQQVLTHAIPNLAVDYVAIVDICGISILMGLLVFIVWL